MWDADPPNELVNICPVETVSGDYCQFPFTYNGVDNYNCIVQSDNLFPRCMTTAKQWSICIGKKIKSLIHKIYILN